MFVTLANGIDPRALDLLREADGVRIETGAPQSAIITDRDLIPVDVEVAEVGEIDGYLNPRPTEKAILLAVNAILDRRTAGRLEDASVSYVDAHGRFWYPGADKTGLGDAQQVQRRGRRLHPATVRLAQLLADHPAEGWSERYLAARGRSTQATAHKLLIRLENQGLVSREGQGRGSLRRVRDVLAMRHWLAREGQSRSATILPCYLRDPSGLPQLPGRSFALTGAAGAAELGISVVTDRPEPMLRVNVNDDELEDIPGGARWISHGGGCELAPGGRSRSSCLRRPDAST